MIRGISIAKMNTRSATEGNSALETPKEAQSPGVPTKHTKRFREEKCDLETWPKFLAEKNDVFSKSIQWIS